METYKKIILGAIVIVAIITVIYYEVNKDETTQITSTETNSSTNDVFEQYLEDDTVDNTTARNLIEDENTIQNVEVTGTDEEKALALAKNKWGAGDNEVYFSIAEQDGNIYYVSVNRTGTTEALAWYKVDVESGEVSDY